MEELKIAYNPGAVSCDFDTIKNYLNTQLDYYKHLVFTEDAKKDAKKTVAELRKEQKAFIERIKEVKKAYMAPFDEFNSQANELVDLFDAPIACINEQIEEFENKRKAEKRELINGIYDELVDIDEIRAIIPLSHIFNKKWENATTNEKAIRGEIMELKLKVKDDLAIIKNTGSDVVDVAIDKYKICLNLGDAMNYISDHEKQKADILAREEERLKREAEDRIRAEERAKIEAEQKHAQELEKAVIEAQNETIEAFIPEDTNEPKETLTYFITLSPSEREALEMYMDSVGIEFKQLPM